VSSKKVKKHAKHVKYILNKFQQNKLFTNRAKSEFAHEEMDFFKHILSRGGVKPNLKKL
jgi:hypothetical protein